MGDNGTILHTSNGGVIPIHKTIVSSPTFSLYPNPAEEFIALKTKSTIQSIQITDVLGRDAFTQESSHLKEGFLLDNILDISEWKPGIYWVKIQTTEGTAVHRVVKK